MCRLNQQIESFTIYSAWTIIIKISELFLAIRNIVFLLNTSITQLPKSVEQMRSRRTFWIISGTQKLILQDRQSSRKSKSFDSIDTPQDLQQFHRKS